MIDGLTILPFLPNWTTQPTLRLIASNGQTMESVRGDESRRVSLRDDAQRELTFSGLAEADARRAFDLFTDQNAADTVIGVPNWSADAVVLTADVAIGATVLHVSETDDIDWRGEGVLVQTAAAGTGLGVIEGFAIDSVTEGVINLVDGLETAFKAGAKVLPLLRARQKNSFDETIASTELDDDMKFDVMEDLASIGGTDLVAPAISYKTLPVFPLLPNWTTSPTRSVTQSIQPIVTGTNREAFAALKAAQRQTFTLTALCQSREQIAALQAFYAARRGRWGRFWLAPVKNDIVITADIGAGDITVQLSDLTSYAARFGPSRRILFFRAGNNYWIRKVAALAGGADHLTLDAALGTAVPASGLQVGLLNLVRFATDDMTLTFDNPLIASADLTFTELESEYTEAIAVAGILNGTIAEGLLS